MMGMCPGIIKNESRNFRGGYHKLRDTTGRLDKM